ncbi:MAG TPA: Hsp20/alpha crystallin family protein [Candidatus Woesearchaeota archaeon]|nr:Hsp20/alpha crystallin family protein [Candidatus Woesearchaeota archaeon]
MVSLFVLLLLVGIPSAYYFGKNTKESKETYLPLSQQQLSNDPFERMEQIHHRMDAMFDKFWNDPYLSYSYEFPSIRDFKTFMPSTRIEHYITDDEIIIKAELPIEDKTGVNVTITEEGVSIKSTQEKHSEQRSDEYYQKEMQSQQFYRYLSLPENADTANAVQTFDSGNLEIKIPFERDDENE